LEIKHRQRQFELARSIAALKAQTQAVKEELEAKLHEAELDDAAEVARIESLKSAVAQRLLMRRKTDDMPIRARQTKEPMGEEL